MADSTARSISGTEAHATRAYGSPLAGLMSPMAGSTSQPDRVEQANSERSVT